MLDADDLRRRLADGGRAGIDERRPHRLQVGRLTQHVDAPDGGDQPHRCAADLRGRVGVLG